MKNQIKKMKWRRVVKLSAFLLLIVSVVAACKKPENTIGKEVYDPEALLDADGVDTFQLITYCELDDSVISSGTNNVLLGSYNDPVFGEVDAGFYSQFRLPTNNPDFGNIGDIIVDSVVLSLEYDDHYGEVTAPQTYRVYRMQEDLYLDTLYYNFQDKLTEATSLVPMGREVIQPKPGEEVMLANDTLDPQLRIPLETSFGWEIINASQNGTLVDNATFLETFKGLYITTENGPWTQGEGSILMLDLTDPQSLITLYYTQAGEQKEYTLLANSSCAYYNRLKFSNAGSKSRLVLDNPDLGMYEFYAQSGLIRAKIDFPSVKDINSKAVVHRAILYLPVSYFTGGEFFPSLVTRAMADVGGVGDNVGIVEGEYNNTFKRYTFALTNYVQDLVKEEGFATELGVKIAPYSFGGSTERIVFNGPWTTNKEKPKLVITYTEY